MKTLSHQRAADWLSRFETEFAKPDRIPAEDVRNVLRRLPLLIRRHGLALAARMLENEATREAKFVCDALRMRLDPTPSQQLPFSESVLACANKAGGFANYAGNMHEAMEYLAWGKQLIEAYMPPPEPGEISGSHTEDAPSGKSEPS